MSEKKIYTPPTVLRPGGYSNFSKGDACAADGSSDTTNCSGDGNGASPGCNSLGNGPADQCWDGYGAIGDKCTSGMDPH